MDDYNITSLYESQNEWVARLVNILTPEIITGFREMLREAIKLCNTNNEQDKYLMTLQNFMARVTKWNENMIQEETKRIIETTGCNYLEDLVSCVHIIQLKCLSCIRVGQKQKKVDIDIPKLALFIHQVYINASRKLYKNIYLFEQKITSLEYQRNQNMLEIMIKESIVNSIRNNIPLDNLLKVYLEDQDEEDVVVNEEIVEERYITENKANTANTNEKHTQSVADNTMKGGIEYNDKQNETIPNIQGKEEGTTLNTNINDELEPLQLNVSLDDDERHYIPSFDRVRPPSAPGRLTFSDIDYALNNNNTEEKISAPKTIERLEEISNDRYIKRLEEDANDEVEEELERIKIENEPINLEKLGLIETL
jgi:hypothetical protein